MRQHFLLVRLMLLTVGVGWLVGPAAARAQLANVARGFSPSGMFDMGGLDVVNGFNGNLMIHIPIGMSYPVGGTMGSYSFTLVYNSNVWDYVQKQGTPCPTNPSPFDTVSIVSPYSNAGLGWNFSLGTLGGEQSVYTAPPPPSSLGYRAPDGSLHPLVDHLTTANGGQLQQPGMRFSNDGSYLRYHQASDGSDVLEFPDGRIQTWGNGGMTIKDRFGNGLTVTYTTDPQTCPGNVWAITDGFRSHRVCFRSTGYSYPDEQAEVVDHIDVASFGGTSTYQFLYNDEDQRGGGFHEIRLSGYGTRIYGCNDPWQPPRVMLLTQLLLPDGTSYRMPSSVYTQPPIQLNGQGQPPFQGVLTNLGLPTSGAIGWVYELKTLPQPHTDENGLWYIPAWSYVPGVNQRSLYDTGGRLVGTWQYNQGAAAEGITPQLNELVNETVYPSPDPVRAAQGASGHRIVTFYSACVYGQCTDAGLPYTYAVDFGLPLSRRRQDATGLSLSQQIYAAGASTPLRQVYVDYESDFGQNPPADQASPIFANERLRMQETVFLDDPVPGTGSLTTVLTTNSDYDGLGHYRTATTSDTTSFFAQRTETTHWNPNAVPVPNQPWVLDTYDFKEAQEGTDLEHLEAMFEPATGFLVCERRFKSGSHRGRSDVLVVRGHDGAGQLTSEQWFGGDTQHLATDTACGSLPLSPVSSYSHAYSAGVRNLTTVAVDGTTTLKLLDDDIDAQSGLAMTSREPAAMATAGRPTTFTYDPMGRVRSVAPAGDATTEFTYTLSDGSPPFIDRRVGASLEEESWQLNGLGRIVAHTVLMPNAAPLTSTVIFNAMGWKTFESEPSRQPGTQGTSYLDYDPFGRPGRVVTADGKRSYFTYRGISSVVKAQGIWTGSREYPFNMRNDFDGLGRLRGVQDGTGILTRYRYDAGGRLKTVTTNGLQARSFNYDGRGFLVSELQPEDGLTTYQYDAKGNMTLKARPTGTVLSTYDKAGRLASVSSPLVLLKQFTYGTGADAYKLREASSFNWRQADACATTEVRQDYSYDPATGRLSSEDTSLWQGTTRLESWTQSYLYDGAGRITQVTYPSCTYLCPATPRQVTTIYSYGKPTSVSGFASSITYGDNGMLATIVHGDGVVFTATPDPAGMPRPGSLRADGPGGVVLWPREFYFYDAAGNIKAIGGKAFAYDGNSRIMSATVPAAGAQQLYEGYTYDAYGNLTSVASGASLGSATTIFYAPQPCYPNNPVCSNRLSGATYDDSGELTAYQGSTYSWDVLGQLTAFNTGSEVWTQLYDAAGERVWSYRTSPSRLDTYALRERDGKVLSIFTKTGSAYTWEDYAYRDGKALGGAFSADGHVVNFDVDHVGSVRLESSTSQSGLVTRYHDYWPFGQEATALTGSGSERMKFAGQERDLGVLTSGGDNASTQDDIDYMHRRYYRSILGRYLSADPVRTVEAAKQRPQMWNRYAYGVGNPLKWIDPAGEVIDLAGLTDDQQQKLLEGLRDFTGDTYDINDWGELELRQVGDGSSKTATDFLNDVIASDTTYEVVESTHNRGHHDTSEVEINFTYFNDAKYGRIDPRTFNQGSNLVHELYHATTGLKDEINGRQPMRFDWTGPVVDFVNKIRVERGFPLRAAYLGDNQPTRLGFGPREGRVYFDHVEPNNPSKRFYVSFPVQ